MKLGIFFSKCDGIVSNAMDLESIAKNYESFPSVKIFDNFYSGTNFDELLMEIDTKELNALILAGESHFAYQQTRNGYHLFRCLYDRGIAPERVEVVNLKNMVALPHDAEPQLMEKKATLLVDMGIEKLKYAQKVDVLEISPRKSVAIIGANLSSVAASQLLLDEGYKVYLISRHKGLSFLDHEAYHIEPTWAYVRHHPRFTFLSQTLVEDFYGYTGDYTLSVVSNEMNLDIQVGAVLLAFDNAPELIKPYHSIFRVDMKLDGSLAARDEVSNRCRTQDRGIFLINPPLHGSHPVVDKFMAADAAVAQVINLLNRREVYHRVTVSRVRSQLCSGCGACVKACIFNAVYLQGNPPISMIDTRRCRGCGNCVAACPADARDLIVCPSNYLFNAIQILSTFEPPDNSPKVLVLACEGCGYKCLDQAARSGMKWPVGIMVLNMICGGQMDTQLIMYAFVKGFDEVVLLVCSEGCCHNIIGSLELERRVHLFREIVESRGIDPNRVHVVTTCSREGDTCVDSINQLYHDAMAS